MSLVGQTGVANYANVTTGDARDVVARGKVGGKGVVVRGVQTSIHHITAENGSFIDTEASDKLITE